MTTVDTCAGCGRPRLLSLKRDRLMQSTGAHKKVCGRELNAPECELECNYTTIARLRAEAERLRGELAEEKRAQFIGPIQEFPHPTFYEALSRAYDEAYAAMAQKPIWAEWINK